MTLCSDAGVETWLFLFEQWICSVSSQNDLFDTTVRKSIRGKKAAASNKGQEDKDDHPGSLLRPHSLVSAEEVEVDKQVNANAAPTGQEVQEKQLLDSCLEGEEEKEASKRANIKGQKKITCVTTAACMILLTWLCFVFFQLRVKRGESSLGLKPNNLAPRHRANLRTSSCRLLNPTILLVRNTSLTCIHVWTGILFLCFVVWNKRWWYEPFSRSASTGQEFVVPTSGYFCSLCSIFYLKENMAKERHCSSRRHYESLQVCSHVHTGRWHTHCVRFKSVTHPTLLFVDRNTIRSINRGLRNLQQLLRTDQNLPPRWNIHHSF